MMIKIVNFYAKYEEARLWSMLARGNTNLSRSKILCGGVNNFSQDAKFRNKVAELNNNQEYQEYEDEDYKDLKALVEGFNTLLPIEEEQPGP